MFLSLRICSAAGVVGPLAASAIIYKKKILIKFIQKKIILNTLAFIFAAFSLVMTFSVAAGTRISHSSYNKLSPS